MRISIDEKFKFLDAYCSMALTDLETGQLTKEQCIFKLWSIARNNNQKISKKKVKEYFEKYLEIEEK
jgi:hypothetical protein